MIIGINIDDKEIRKSPSYYITFLSELTNYYPILSTVELTYCSFLWAEPYNFSLCKETVSILNKYPFSYSIHFPEALNYIQKKNDTIKQCIEFAQNISSNKIIIHSISEPISPLIISSSFLKDTEKLNHINLIQMKRESDLINQLLEETSNNNINLYLENALLKYNNNVYSYSANLILLAEQIKKLEGKNIYICLDWGHAFLSSEYLGIKFNDIIKEIFQYVSHMHVHNNYGIDKYDEVRIFHKHPNGDYHLPIYKGKIKFKDFYYLLNNYTEVLMLEYTFCNCDNLKESITKSIEYLNELNLIEN